MVPTLGEIWTAAGVLIGFEFAVLSFRLNRELQVRAAGGPVWLPPADYLSLLSMLVAFIGVFVAPILGIGTLESVRLSFGLAIVLMAGWPLAIAGHYGLFFRAEQKAEREVWFPRQERLAFAVVVVALILYLVVAIASR